MRKRGWTDVLVGSVCLAVVLATGCEDEDGKKAPSELAQASANAGPGQTVLVDAEVTLDASASHGAGDADDPEGTTPTSYAWVQDPADTTQVTLTGATTAKPTFTPTVAGTYNFEVTVDGKTDTVTVTVQLGTVDVGPDIVVGGYGKTITITPDINVPATADQYQWTKGSSPVPAEWSPSMDASGVLTVTTPLLTDLKIIPDEFGVLSIGAQNVSRADTSGSMSFTFTAADDLVSPTESYTDTLNIQIVEVTTGGTVVPVGVPCFLNAGNTANGTDAFTGISWMGTSDLTLPDGETVDPTAQVQMFVPEAAGSYYFTCGRSVTSVLTRTVNGTGAYHADEKETVITITTTDLTEEAHIGWDCVFANSGTSYEIVGNEVGTILVKGNASGEAADDDVEITATIPQGIVIRAAEYVGVGSIAGRTPDQDKAECASCHKGQYDIVGDQVTEWAASGHNQIFKNMFTGGRYSADEYNDISCFHCHTTGFMETDASSNDGFDDRAAATGVKFASFTADEAGYNAFVRQYPTVADMAFVQCEACHGPGSTHDGDTGGTAAVTLTGMCAQCHEGHGHAVTQWARGTHAKLIDSDHANQDCSECHAGQGLPVKLRGEEVPDLAAGEPVPQNCGTCHDSHSLELRDEGEVELPNGVKFDFGHSAICANCHNGRRDTSVGAALSPTMPHHGSQQAVMLAGTGAFEFADYTYVNGPHAAGTDAKPTPAHCNDCHMAEKKAYRKIYHRELTDMPYEAVGGHTWKMRFGTDNTTLVDQTTSTSAAVNVDTRELKITGATAGSFVGLVEIGDTITFDGSDGGTFAVQAVLSADTVIVEDPDPDNPTMFAGVTDPSNWSITRDEVELVESCNTCHKTWTLSTLAVDTAKNWDGSGTTATPVQTRIQNLCNDLLAAIEAALTAKVGRAATLVDYRKGTYNDGYHDYEYPKFGKSNKDREVQAQDAVDLNGVYTAGTDTTVLTLVGGGLTPDDHIGDVCVFVHSGEQYDIVDNAAGTVTVDGDASGELTDDTVSIATETPSDWDDEWEIIYKATYNYFFVLQDHSGGIHNPGYAVGLLRSSYDALTPQSGMAALGGVDYTEVP